MKIDKGSDSMVEMDIKNSNEKSIWMGYLSNHTVIKKENKYEDKLENNHSRMFSYLLLFDTTQNYTMRISARQK